MKGRSKKACNYSGCGRWAVVVVRIESDRGPMFVAFCPKHLSVASRLMAELHKDMRGKGAWA